MSEKKIHLRTSVVELVTSIEDSRSKSLSVEI